MGLTHLTTYQRAVLLVAAADVGRVGVYGGDVTSASPPSVSRWVAKRLAKLRLLEPAWDRQRLEYRYTITQAGVEALDLPVS